MSQSGADDMTGANTVTVASGKGGVGKTWFAITLAQALALGGRKCLLVDGDFGLANVDVQLGLGPRHDLGSVIAGSASLEEARLTYRPGGEHTIEGAFDILTGQSGSGTLSALRDKEIDALQRGIAHVGAGYDHVILDLAAGLDGQVRTLCNHDGRHVIVVTPDPTSITDAYAFIKLLLRQNGTADIRIVVNQAADKNEGQRTYASLAKACGHFLGVEPVLAGLVPADAAVREAIRRQSALYFRHPQSGAGAAVKKIAGTLLEPAMQRTKPASPLSRSAAR